MAGDMLREGGEYDWIQLHAYDYYGTSLMLLIIHG